jgi:ketosteroid isomerase-like protein
MSLALALTPRSRPKKTRCDHGRKEKTMSGELANAARDFTAALDSMDVDRLLETMADDAQGVDEISRRWIRGKGDLDNYLRELISAVSGVQTELRDVEERIWGMAAS